MQTIEVITIGQRTSLPENEVALIVSGDLTSCW
jgi:hypothetical protein